MMTQSRNSSGFQLGNIQDSLAKELQRRKLDKEARQKEIDKVIMESDEINHLKQKIQIAQMNKERTKQIAETQLRKVNYLSEEASLEQDLLRKKIEEDRIESIKQSYRKEMRYDNKYVIKNQIVEKEDLAYEARDRYLEEKDTVDQVMQKIINEDRKNFELEQHKKKLNYQAMQETLAEKAERISREKLFEKEQNEKYKQFYAQKEEQQNFIKEKKRLEDEAKEQLFERLRIEEESRRMGQEELVQLRLELQQEEFDKKERDKERAERTKRERQKKEMQAFEREQKAEKDQRRQDEWAMEQEFRRMMMAKFAQDEKLEQLSNQKRRQREIEHKNQVERLWQEKLEFYRSERENQLLEIQKKEQLEQWKREVVYQEKQRLLNQYLAELEAYMPKGLVQHQEDKELLTGIKENKKVGYNSNFKM